MGDALTCDGFACERELLAGDAITLDGATYCAPCALDRAAAFLEDLLSPAYTPEELRARQYQQAREVMQVVLARVDARMREVGAARAS